MVRAVESGRHVDYERKGLLDPERVENVVAYPLMAAQQAKDVDRIYISTDSPKLKGVTLAPHGVVRRRWTTASQ